MSLVGDWNFENKLESADVDADATSDILQKFDALGRRIARDDGTTTTIYVQSGQQTVADYTVGTAASSPTYRYVYASYIDEPVMRAGSLSTARLYYHRNQQYSITALTDATGTISERYAYDAYGKLTVLDGGGTVLGGSAYGNRYTYTGREWDGELGLYHYRARMYDPVTGRFVSRDPIGFEGSPWNVYEFLDSSPLIGMDPSGRSIFVDNGVQVHGLHQRICVTTYDGACTSTGRLCISFGIIGENEGSSSGEGGGSDSDDPAAPPNLPGAVDDDGGDGIIYIDTEPASGLPVEGFGSCCEAEKKMEAYMRSLVGRRGNYCLPHSSCRSFSKQLLSEIRSKYRNGDFGECPCPQWWQRALGGMGPLGPPHIPFF